MTEVGLSKQTPETVSPPHVLFGFVFIACCVPHPCTSACSLTPRTAPTRAKGLVLEQVYLSLDAAFKEVQMRLASVFLFVRFLNQGDPRRGRFYVVHHVTLLRIDGGAQTCPFVAFRPWSRAKVLQPPRRKRVPVCKLAKN